MSTPFVAFDWDGVLHKCRSYHPGPFVDIDLAPLRMALARGWRVQIVTANDDLAGIAQALRNANIRAYADHRMYYRDWPEHRQQEVIISQRKMWTDYIVDDRAIQYHFGTGTVRLIATLEETMKVRRQEKELLHR